MFQDNQAAIKLSMDKPVNFKGRSRFIKRKYFEIYEYVQQGDIELVYLGTDSMIADFLTKVLVGGKFEKFKIAIMGLDSE